MITGVKKELPIDDIRVVKNAPKKYDDTERVLLIDADSIMYTATYFPEDSLIDFPTEEEQIEEAKYRTRTKLQEIQNNVEEWFNIVQTYIFIGGKNNFRYKIFPEYKANRATAIKSPYLPIVRQYMIDELLAIESHGGEADDYIIDGIQISEGNCIVSSIDKDVLYHAANVPLYDYRGHTNTLGEFKYISTKESRLARATQVVTGDSTDGIPGAKGVGKAWCDKNMHIDMTDYQFIKAIYQAYLKATKNDVIEAKRQIRLYYKVLKLHTLEEMKKLI
jgi:DNA polymerase-1